MAQAPVKASLGSRPGFPAATVYGTPSGASGAFAPIRLPPPSIPDSVLFDDPTPKGLIPDDPTETSPYLPDFANAERARRKREKDALAAQFQVDTLRRESSLSPLPVGYEPSTTGIGEDLTDFYASTPVSPGKGLLSKRSVLERIKDTAVRTARQAGGLATAGLSYLGVPDADAPLIQVPKEPERSLAGLTKGAVQMINPLAPGLAQRLGAKIQEGTEALGAFESPNRQEATKIFAEELAAKKAAQAARGAGGLDRAVMEAEHAIETGLADPTGLLGDALGSAIPFLGLGKVLAPLKIAGKVMAPLMGVPIEAGSVKLNIAEAVKRAPLEKLMPDPRFAADVERVGPEAARKNMSIRASEYFESPVPIAVGAIEGAVLSMIGADAAMLNAGSGGARRAMSDLVKKGSESALRTGLVTGLKETGQEFLQEGLTSWAGNVGAAGGGADIDPMEGVVESAVMGGLTGGPAGGVAGAREVMGARRELRKRGITSDVTADRPSPEALPNPKSGGSGEGLNAVLEAITLRQGAQGPEAPPNSFRENLTNIAKKEGWLPVDQSGEARPVNNGAEPIGPGLRPGSSVGGSEEVGRAQEGILGVGLEPQVQPVVGETLAPTETVDSLLGPEQGRIAGQAPSSVDPDVLASLVEDPAPRDRPGQGADEVQGQSLPRELREPLTVSLAREAQQNARAARTAQDDDFGMAEALNAAREAAAVRAAMSDVGAPTSERQLQEILPTSPENEQLLSTLKLSAEAKSVGPLLKRYPRTGPSQAAKIREDYLRDGRLPTVGADGTLTRSVRAPKTQEVQEAPATVNMEGLKAALLREAAPVETRSASRSPVGEVAPKIQKEQRKTDSEQGVSEAHGGIVAEDRAPYGDEVAGARPSEPRQPGSEPVQSRGAPVVSKDNGQPKITLDGRQFSVEPQEVEGKKVFILRGKSKGAYVAVEYQPGGELTIHSVGAHGNVDPKAPSRSPFPGASLRVVDGNLVVKRQPGGRAEGGKLEPHPVVKGTPEQLVNNANKRFTAAIGAAKAMAVQGKTGEEIRQEIKKTNPTMQDRVVQKIVDFTMRGKKADAATAAFAGKKTDETDGTVRETAAEYGNWKNYQLEQPRPKVGIVKGPSDVGRVSPRKPSAVGRSEHGPGGETLEINTEAIEQSKNHLEKVAAAVSQYNTAFGGDPNDWKNPAQTIRAFKNIVVKNLVALHNMMPAELRRRAQLWYEGANRMSNDWSKKYGISVSQAAGVMAAHSPQKEWFSNVSLAERTIHIVKDYADFAWSKDMTAWVRSYIESDPKPEIRDSRRPLLKVAERLEGTPLSEMKLEDAAKFVRVFDETYHDKSFRVVTPEGGFGDFSVNDDGVTKTPVAWPGYDTIEKAVSILMDGSQKNISANVGWEHKVRSFFNSILDPKSAKGDVVIDTHAVGAALMKALSGKSLEVNHNFGTTPKGITGAGGSNITGASGTYGILADAYREAAAQLGIRPNQLQSITWEAVRSMFPDSTKDTVTQLVEPIWNKAKAGEISREEAERQVLAVSGGVKSTPWAGTPAGVGADQMESFNTKRLPPQLLEVVPEKAKIQIQLSANTGQVKELGALRDAADNGNADAGAKLSAIAESGLKEVLKGTTARVKVEYTTGLYGGYLEPALTASVEFDSSDMAEVVDRLKAFADTFKQEQVHVLQKIYTPRGMEAPRAGYKWKDGSYATPAYTWTTDRALTRAEIERVIKSSGLAGLTFGDNVVTAYFVEFPGKSIEAQINEFESRISKASGSLRGLSSEVAKGLRRLWPYGQGGGAIGWPGASDSASVLPAQREAILDRSTRAAGRFLRQAEKAAAAKAAEPSVAREGQAEYAYLPDGTPYPVPATRADAIDAAREAIDELSRDFGPSSVSPDSGRVLSGVRAGAPAQAGGAPVLDAHIAVPDALKTRGIVDLVGQIVRTVRDLAIVARVARDPRYETMGFLFKDQNGKVLAQELLTSRDPGFVAAFDAPGVENMSPRERAAALATARSKFHERLRRKMERLSKRPGVTKVTYVMWHNHPGGRPMPGEEDTALTQSLARAVPGFEFHVVLDGNEYGVIELTSAQGDAGYLKTDGGTVFAGDTGQRVRVAEMRPLVGPDVSPDVFFAGNKQQSISSPDELVEFADQWRKLRPEGQVIVVLIDSQNRSRAVIPVPNNLFKNARAFSDYIRGLSRDWGARRALAVFDSTGDPGMALVATAHVRRGVMSDFLDESGGNRLSLYRGSPRHYEEGQRAKKEEAYTQKIRSQRVGEEQASRREPPKGGFYSALERAAEQMKQQMRGGDALRLLSGREGVKKAELEATGLWKMLTEKATEKVTPEEVQEFLKANKVTITEVTKGADIEPEPVDTTGWKASKNALTWTVTDANGEHVAGLSVHTVQTAADAIALQERIPPGDPRRDENFRRWFKQSAAVDANGEPKVVYHATPDGEITFEGGRPAFFTDSPTVANDYTMKRGMWRSGGKAPAVYPAFLSIQNPLEIDALGKRNDNVPVPWQTWSPKVFGNLPKNAVNMRAIVDYAKANGYDGVIVKNVVDTADITAKDKSTVYVTLEPSQIKSATGNRGTFDPSDPSIVAEERQPYGDPHISVAEERAPYGTPKEPEKRKAPAIPAGMGRPVNVTPMAVDDIAARVAAASKGTGTPDGTPISELAPPEFHRNMARVLQVLDKPEAERLARIYDVFDKEMDTAKSKLTWEQGDKEALKLLGVHTREQFLQMAQRGVIFNEPGLRAATRVMYEVEAENREALKTLEEAKAKGGGGIDSDEFQKYVASATDLAAWIMALRGEQAEAARAFGARKDLKGKRNTLERLIGALAGQKAKVGGGALSVEEVAKITDAVQRDPSLLPDVIRNIQKPTFWDMINEWRKGAMLFGVRTYGVNFFGNAFKQALTLAEIPGAAVTDYLKTPKGQPRQVYMGEIAAARAGIADFGPAALSRLVAESKDALKGVENFDPETNKYDFRTGAIPGPLGKFIRTPFRLLTAADNFFKDLARGQSLYREAYRRARNEGLTGQNAATRADELVNIGKGSDWQDRRVAGMLEKANRVAEYETFTRKANYETAGVFGAIAEAAVRLEKTIPPFVLFAPFKNTPANIAFQGYERSILGWASVINRARELEELTRDQAKATKPAEKKRLQDEIEQKREEFANQVSRAAIGSALTILAAAMATMGMLTGSGPSDPDKNRVWRKAGNIPNAIKVGDSDWYAYDRFEPIATSISMAASVPEAMQETSAVDVGARAIDALHNAFVAKTYLQGMEELGQLIKHPLIFGKRWLRDLEGSFVPAILGHTAEAVDPTVRDTKQGILDPIKARIPGLSKGLPETDSGTGEPATRTERLGGAKIGPLNPLGFIRSGSSKGDPLYKQFFEADYAPDPHRTYISVGVGPVGAKRPVKIDLTQDELALFKKADGVVTERLRRAVENPGFLKLDPDQKRAYFRKEYAKASDAAKSRVMPAVMGRLRKQLSEEKK